MAIQFACSGCGRAIEVDDEWANSRVTCPYCQEAVTAPGESTLEVGTARAAGGEGEARVGTNVLGRWSLICGVAALGVFAILLCVGIVRMKPAFDELEEGGASPAKVQQEMRREMERRLGGSRAVLAASAALLGLGLVGTIFGVVGLTRRGVKKGQAAMGLVICGSFLLCQCAGVLMQIMGRLGKG